MSGFGVLVQLGVSLASRTGTVDLFSRNTIDLLYVCGPYYVVLCLLLVGASKQAIRQDSRQACKLPREK
jgi:hypothetical protein